MQLEKITLSVMEKRPRVKPDQLEDDLRRMILSQLALVRRRWPYDWQRMVRQVEAQDENIRS